MHEMSIATELLDQVLSYARQNDAIKVDSVEVECGVQRQVVLEALIDAWRAVVEDTIADGSKLTLTEKPVKARCNICNNQFSPGIDYYLCPQCNEADVELIEGNDILLTSLTCEAENNEES
jgi:hydrogenase nickel incorporation protein HypA/HybF